MRRTSSPARNWLARQWAWPARSSISRPLTRWSWTLGPEGRAKPCRANPNWARWVFASVASYLKRVAEEAHLPALVEGLDDRTTEFMEATDRCEIRITGRIHQGSQPHYFYVEVRV